jgi:hypothetical protein
MSDVAITETIPIYSDDDGRMRVSGTRVLFDLLVYAYNQGKTPEHIIPDVSYPVAGKRVFCASLLSASP